MLHPDITVLCISLKPYCCCTGFVLTTNFWYFSGQDQHIEGEKSAVGQTYHLLFYLTSFQKKEEKKEEKTENAIKNKIKTRNTHTKHRKRVLCGLMCYVCVCVCERERERESEQVCVYVCECECVCV